MIEFYPRKGTFQSGVGLNKISPSNELSAKEKFSIIIPSWNNLEYLKLCVRSILNHSQYDHQIIIHVNEGSDGTLQWVQEQGYDYTFSKENVGICWAVNACVHLARTDYIVYLNDDMYFCPGWDTEYVKYIESIGHDNFFISSTMIEPTDSGNPAVIVCSDFGDTAESFIEEELLRRYAEFEKGDWSGGTFPPNIVAKKLWDIVGGYSVEFSPGMATDPDFSMKLWQYGVRHIVGLGRSRVYHFQCKSTGRVKRNDGRRQFLRKWRTAISTFRKWYLQYGSPFNGPLNEAKPPRSRVFKDRLRSKW